MTTDAEAKRQRLSSALPELGCDESEFLADRGLLLRHGTSLQLMSQVTTVLAESQEFGDLDPSADWEKWQARRPEFSLYYAALVDPARDGADAYQCVLRAVLDGFPEPKPPHRQRLVIDYVTTRQAARGRGLASVLIQFVLEASKLFGANSFVLATEDSCPFWLGQGFVLEEGKPLNARINIFNDTHLLRLQSDGPDAGAEEDLELAQGEGEEEGEEEEEEEEMDEDAALQAALASSLVDAPPRATQQQAASEAAVGGGVVEQPGEEDEDEELKAAIALSLAPK